MITNQKRIRNHWRYIGIIPMLFLMLGLFSFKSPEYSSKINPFVRLSVEHPDLRNFESRLVQSTNALPTALPLQLDGEKVVVTSSFGKRSNPYDANKHQWHRGIDFRAPIGTPIVATADGEVIDVINQSSGFGKMLVLAHADQFKTRYAHMDSFQVEKGDRVTKGQVIGTVGNTGKSTGPHLHYEVWKSEQPVDPEKYITGLHAK